MKAGFKITAFIFILLLAGAGCQKKNARDAEKIRDDYVFDFFAAEGFERTEDDIVDTGAMEAKYGYGNPEENGFKFAYSYVEGFAKINGYDGRLASIVTPTRFNGLPVKDIGERAFVNKGLDSVVISEGVNFIRKEAFNSNQLISVTIPNSVKEIESFAFSQNRLVSIAIGANVKFHASVFDNNFYEFYNKNGKKAGAYFIDGYQWAFQESPQPDRGYIPSTGEWELISILMEDRAKRPRNDGSEVKTARACFAEAQDFYAQKEYEKAIENYVLICQTYTWGIVYYHLGISLMDAGNYDAAKRAFEQSIRFRDYNEFFDDLYTVDSNGARREPYFAYYNIACIESLQNNIAAAYENVCKALFFGYPYMDHIKNDYDLQNLFAFNKGSYLKLVEEVYHAGSNNTVAGKAFGLNWGGAPLEYHFISQNRMDSLVGSVWPDPSGWRSGDYEVVNYLILVKNIQYHFDEYESFRRDKLVLYVKDFEDLTEQSEYKEIPLERYQ